MAANEYYSPVSPVRSHGRPTDATIPHLGTDSSTSFYQHPSQSTSPYMSPPQDDYSYRPYDHSQHSTPTPYYSSGGGGRENEGNPFADDIPLRQNPSKGSPVVGAAEPFPDDPAISDARKHRSRRKPKRGFFSGKIPWVVYTLTLIQCVVFIAELAKNGIPTNSSLTCLD